MVGRAGDHRQDAGLGAVGEEDLAEARRDDAADAEIRQRPHRLLAARSGPEARPGDEDAGAVVGRPVQHEVRHRTAILAPPPVVEQVFPQPVLVQQQQEARREDDVRIDIGVGEWRGDAGQGGNSA